MSDLVRAAFATDRVILSVMGAHAGEDESAIFARKMGDISSSGQTFWVYGSHSARPDRVQISGSRYVLFLSPASSNGARPTTTSVCASCFSRDKNIWAPLPTVGPVTGKLPSYAFVMSELSFCAEVIDLWEYASVDSAVRFRLGASTVIANRRDTSTDPLRMRSRFRRVVAIGKLVEPFAVWVK